MSQIVDKTLIRGKATIGQHISMFNHSYNKPSACKMMSHTEGLFENSYTL